MMSRRVIGRAKTFNMMIDLRVAKRLGLTIPQSILLRADEVIEWESADEQARSDPCTRRVRHAGARRPSAAGRKAVPDRLFRGDVRLGLRAVPPGLRARATRAGIRRGEEHRHRVPLGRRLRGASCRTRRSARAAESRRDRVARHRCARRPAGHLDHPDRDGSQLGSGGAGPGQETGQARRQYHRGLVPDSRPCGEAPGVAQGSRPATRVPRLDEVAVLSHASSPAARKGLAETELAAQKLGVRVRPFWVAEEPTALDSVLTAVARERPAGIIVQPDPLFSRYNDRIAAFAVKLGSRRWAEPSNSSSMAV